MAVLPVPGTGCRRAAGGPRSGWPDRAGDRGSIAPLVVGLAVCLLLITMGIVVTADVFLARQRLQGLCDGAAVAGANAQLLGQDPQGTAQGYLDRYASGMTAQAGITATGAVSVRCATTTAIPLGRLFGAGTVPQSVTSVAQPEL